MKVLIVGDSSREHALAAKLADSPRIDKVYLIPGNDGTEELYINEKVLPDDYYGIVKFAKDNGIDIAVIGSEKHLINGLADELDKSGVLVFGPSKKAAQIKDSRMTAKNFLKKNHIPTPDYVSYGSFDHLLEDLDNEEVEFTFPLIVKAHGQSEEDHIFIAQDEEDLSAIAQALMVDRELGSAGNNIILEEYVEGQPASILSFIDNESIIPVLTSQETYKEGEDSELISEATVSPGDIFAGEDGERLLRRIYDTILLPTIEGLHDERIDYNGALTVDMMVDEKGLPQVLDYTISFDNDMAANLNELLNSELVDALKATANNTLDMAPIDVDHNSASVSLVILDEHPDATETDKEIKGLEDITDSEVYFSNVKKQGDKLFASGKHVLTLTASAPTEQEAWNKVYMDAEKLMFDGITYLTEE